MRVRLFTYALVAAGFVGGGALTVDALTTTDEEQLEALIDALVESPDVAMMDWSDPSAAEVEAQVGGRRAAGADAMASLRGDDVEIVQRSVQVDGDRASVAVRARVDGRLADARLRLSRHEDRWLVRHVTAR